MASSYRLFAFHNDQPEDYRREGIPLELLGKAVRWAVGKGCDTILVQLGDGEPFNPNVVHHVCADAGCPGGC